MSSTYFRFRFCQSVKQKFAQEKNVNFANYEMKMKDGERLALQPYLHKCVGKAKFFRKTSQFRCSKSGKQTSL